MNREFATNAVLIVLINLLVKSFYLFGIDRTVQNILPEGQYGLYFTLFTFAFLFQIAADFGLQNFNARQVSQSRHLLTKYFPYLLGVKSLLGVGYLLVVGVAGFLWGFHSLAWQLLMLIGLNQFLQTLILFLRSNLAGLGLYRLDSVVSVLDKSLLILICGLLLWAPAFRGDFRLEWFVWAHTLAYTLTIFVLLTYLSRRLGSVRLRFRKPVILYFLRSSAPYALVIFLMTAYTRLDGVMIERLLDNGLVEADRYASAFRLLDASNVAGFLLAGLLLPMFSRQIKEKVSVVPLIRLGITTIWVGAISLAISVWWFATPLMEALYTDGNAYSGRIVQWLMLAFIPMSGTYVYGTLLTANGNLRRMNQIFAAGFMLNLTLNLVLIPSMAAEGAALATFITQSIVFLAQVVLAMRLLKLSWAPSLLMQLLLFSGLIWLVGWALSGSSLSWHWSVKFLACVSVGGLLAFLLRLLDLRSWLAWFSR